MQRMHTGTDDEKIRVDFDMAEKFFNWAKVAHESGDEIKFIAGIEMMLVALGRPSSRRER